MCGFDFEADWSLQVYIAVPLLEFLPPHAQKLTSLPCFQVGLEPAAEVKIVVLTNGDKGTSNTSITSPELARIRAKEMYEIGHS